MYRQIVPVMKSNSQNGFEVSASSEYYNEYGTYYAYEAFDQDKTTFWHSLNANIGWLKIKFPKTFTVNKIIYYTYNGPSGNDYHPNKWIVQGSTDGNTWKDLKSFTSPYYYNSKVEVTFAKTKMNYLRLYANSTCLQGGESYKEIGELEIYGYENDYLIKTDDNYIGTKEYELSTPILTIKNNNSCLELKNIITKIKNINKEFSLIKIV